MAPLGDARLRARRLRLHDVHRQLRPARRAGRRRRSRPTSWSSRPCCRATATSRAASTRWRGPRTSPRRRWSSRSRWPAASTSTSRRSRWASAATASRSCSPTSGRRPDEVRDGHRRLDRPRAVPRAPTPSVFEGDERWRALPIPSGDRYAWDDGLDLHRAAAVLRGARPREPAPLTRHRRRARARGARRLGHDRPHLPGRARSPPGRPAGAVAPGARRRRRSSSTRYGARRGHHEVMMRGTFGNIRLRNRLAEDGGSVHAPPARRRGGVHLRRGDALPRRGRAAARHRRPRVRLRLVARLGGQGHAAARASAPSSPRATSASTAPTSSAWACCRSSSCPARAPRRWASPAARRSRSTASPTLAPTPGGDGGRALRRTTAPSGASGRSPASTARSRSSTSARAGSCRRCCGGSPASDGRPFRHATKPPGTARGLRVIRVLCGAGRRPSREDILQWLRRETPRGCDAVPDRGSRGCARRRRTVAGGRLVGHPSAMPGTCASRRSTRARQGPAGHGGMVGDTGLEPVTSRM